MFSEKDWLAKAQINNKKKSVDAYSAIGVLKTNVKSQQILFKICNYLDLEYCTLLTLIATGHKNAFAVWKINSTNQHKSMFEFPQK